jgi:hypothetical protein
VGEEIWLEAQAQVVEGGSGENFDGKVYFIFKVFLISMIYDFEAIKKRNGVLRYFFCSLASFLPSPRSPLFPPEPVICYDFILEVSVPFSGQATVHKFLSNGWKGLIYSPPPKRHSLPLLDILLLIFYL